MALDESPVTRKVQIAGGSTYTISLPKSWAKQQKIEAGTPCHLYPQRDRLILTPVAAAEARHGVSIDSSNREPADLSRSIAAAYVAGCEEIVVTGRPDSDQRRAIRDILRGLVGIEVHAEDEDRMIARTMLDVRDLSPKQTLVQIEQLALLMHEDAVEAVLTGDAEQARDVQRRDDDVDRLFGLVCREFHLSLTDLQIRRQDGTTTFEYYTVARQLERIADHAEKIAAVGIRVDTVPPEEITTEVAEVSERARGLVHRAFSSFFDEDGDDFGTVIAEGQAVVDAAEEMDRILYNRGTEEAYLLSTVVDSIVRTAEYGMNIAEAGLQASMRVGDE